MQKLSFWSKSSNNVWILGTRGKAVKRAFALLTDA
jgi:hypothetical protein